MTESNLLVDAIERATKEVFETMLGAELLLEDPSRFTTNAGVVSLVGLTGNWSGTGTLSCTPESARLMASRFLMMDVDTLSPSIDSDVLDAVAELTNMVVGNIKNLLSEHLGEMAISIPTVIYGRNFHFKSFAGMSQGAVVFSWETHAFQVKIGLAPTFEPTSAIRQRLSSPAFSAT